MPPFAQLLNFGKEGGYPPPLRSNWVILSFVFLPSYFLRGGIVFSHNGCIEQLLDDPNAMLPARAYRPPWISARCSKLLGSDGAGVYTLAAPNNVSSMPLNAHTEMQMTLLSLLTKMTHLRRRKHMLHPHLTKFSQVSALVYFQKSLVRALWEFVHMSSMRLLHAWQLHRHSQKSLPWYIYPIRSRSNDFY